MSLTTAHNRLRNAGISQLPVMRDGRLVGVLTEDDIMRFAFGRPELLNSPVADAMQTAFVRLDKSTAIEKPRRDARGSLLRRHHGR